MPNPPLSYTSFLIFALILSSLLPFTCLAQSPVKKDSITPPPQLTKLHFLETAPNLHKGRTIALSSISAASYITTLVLLERVWYNQFERTKFHFFNDNKEWNQIDKIGHTWTAYSEGLYGMALYRWAGLKDPTAIWLGGTLGSFFQMGVEVLDGFSAKWGASTGDILANTMGSVLLVGQELAWKEQRILLKFSTHQEDYSKLSPVLQARATDLYGSSWQELMLKDYNGQSYWLSLNLHSFNKKSKLPKWLNVAVGYGVGGLFGGFENTWENEDGDLVDFSDIERYRKVFVSFDLDLSRIKTKSRFLNFVLSGFNVFKFPAPALEINTKGQFKFHALYW